MLISNPVTRLIGLLLIVVLSPSHAGIISTIAGNGTAGFSGDGALAINAGLPLPFKITIDNNNIIYSQSETSRVRLINTHKIINSSAADGSNNPFIMPATTTSINTDLYPVDSQGNRYFSDKNQVFMLSPTGRQTIIAGIIPLANIRYSRLITDGEPALRFLSPVAHTLTLDNNDTLYFKSFNYILRLNRANLAQPTLNIIATENKATVYDDLIFNSLGNLYAVSSNRNQVLQLDSKTGAEIYFIGNGIAGFGGDGKTPSTAQLNFPYGLSVDSYGDLYIADFLNHRLRHVDLIPPTASFTLDNNSRITNNTSVNLTIKCQDGPHGSGCIEMRLSNDNISWNPWQAFTITANWSLTTGDGLKTVYLQLRDAGGTGVANTSTTIQQQITLDTTSPAAPVILSPLSNSTHNNAALTITGFSEPDTTIELFSHNGQQQTSLGLNTSNASGTWSFNHNFNDGSYTLTTFTTDTAGNSSPFSTAVNITIDTTVPPAPVITTPITLTSSNSTTQIISGTAEANSSLQLFDNGTLISTLSVNAAGDWTTTATLTDGVHSLTAIATDNVGNSGVSSATITITVNTTPAPVSTTITPPTGTAGAVTLLQTVNSPNINLSTQCTPGNNGALCTLMRFSNDGINWSSWNNYSPNASWTLSDGDGTKTVYIQFQDNSGTLSQTITTQLVLDTQAPTTPVMAGFNALAANSGNELISNQENQRLSGRAEANSRLEIFSEGISLGVVSVNGNGDWQLDHQFSEGSHKLTTRSRDAAGNLSARSTTFSLIIDITTPVIQLIGSNDIQIIEGSDYIDAGANASDTLDGDISSKITTSVNVNRTLLDTTQPGSYFINYQVTDRAGNITTTQRKITVVKAADCSNISSAGVKNRKADCNITGFGAPPPTQSGGGSLSGTTLWLLFMLLLAGRQYVCPQFAFGSGTRNAASATSAKPELL